MVVLEFQTGELYARVTLRSRFFAAIPCNRTGSTSLVADRAGPGNWVPPIPGGMTGAAYQNYPNRAPPVILAGKPE